MRKDIEIHINTGDVAISHTNTYTKRGFRWVENSTGLSRYTYGEIDIPATIPESQIREEGFVIEIPYTPVYKECMVRIRRVDESGNFEYLVNQTNGTAWFTVVTGLYGAEDKTAIHASEFTEVSNSDYYMAINGTNIEMYSGYQSDFNVVDASKQNNNCLLACVPTNNYRYPVSGVGLVRWINASNINASDLAEVIKQEFYEDGVSIKNAYYDYDTQRMELETELINEDE